MVDRVRLRKMESVLFGGSQTDDMPTGINPNEDYADVRGVSIQDLTSNDETTLIDRLGLDMRFKDGNNAVPVTLTQLLSGSGTLLHAATFTAQFLTGDDEISGTVSGLGAAPLKVFGFGVRDDSGDDDLIYASKITALNADGFDYVVRMIDDESWEQPSPLSLTVDYVWSEV